MEQNNTQGFTPFRQIPTWSDTAEFTITGTQLKAIQALFEAYTPFVKALEPVFLTGLDNGSITINYEDLEGNPLEKEKIDNMLELYAQSMAKQLSDK